MLLKETSARKQVNIRRKTQFCLDVNQVSVSVDFIFISNEIPTADFSLEQNLRPQNFWHFPRDPRASILSYLPQKTAFLPDIWRQYLLLSCDAAATIHGFFADSAGTNLWGARSFLFGNAPLITIPPPKSASSWELAVSPSNCCLRPKTHCARSWGAGPLSAAPLRARTWSAWPRRMAWVTVGPNAAWQTGTRRPCHASTLGHATRRDGTSFRPPVTIAASQC